MKVSDICDKEDMVIVKIPKTKTDKPRTFIINKDFYNIYKKYAALRPDNVETPRFFLYYSNGKCTKQVIGINTFGNMPKVVARYLKLENPESYTGHSFRRTSATLLADAGADMLTIKRHGGWKSDTVAAGYVEESMHSKKKIAKNISSSICNPPRTSTSHSLNPVILNQSSDFNTNSSSTTKEISKENLQNNSKYDSKNVSLQFTNCTNVTIVLGDNSNQK